MKFDVNIHHHVHIPSEFQRMVEETWKGVNELMKNVDEVLAAVEAQQTVVDGVLTLVTSLREQVADALSHVGIDAATQAKLDTIFDDVSANTANLNSALNANTAVAPEPPAVDPATPSA